jgi:hypothetical protein
MTAINFDEFCIGEGSMSYTRRSVTGAIIIAAAAISVASTSHSQPQRPTVQPSPSPYAPNPNPNYPPALNGPEQKSGDRALVVSLILYSRPQRPSVEPLPSPNTPDPNHPWGLGGHGERPSDRKAIDKQNQAEVKADVEKLYVLITELKEQVEKSDVNLTLPVSVVKKSHEIEKLAKHVKDLAKG